MTGPLDTLIAERFDTLAPQLQKAARWVVDHPQEVALLSMREQARHADVTPATMTRLAQALDLAGFDTLRAAHAETMRAASLGLSSQAAAALTEGDDIGARTLGALARHLAGMAQPGGVQGLGAAADRIVAARRIYCVGSRSSFGIAWHLHYALSLVTDRTRLLDGAGAVATDALVDAGAQDVLCVVGQRPYASASVAITEFARARGVGIVALTDGALSPLSVPAGTIALVFPAASPGILGAMTPALALAEALSAEVAARLGPAAQDRIARIDAHLAAFGTFHTTP